MRMWGLMIILMLSLLVISGCTDQELKSAICKDTTGDSWYVKLWCMFQGTNQTEATCSDRMHLADGNCVCNYEYPIQYRGSCYTANERFDQGGKITECATIVSQPDRIRCLAIFADSKDKCDSLSYELRTDCLTAQNPAFRTCMQWTTVLFDDCISENAKSLTDCNMISNTLEIEDCVKRLGNNYNDCLALDSKHRDSCYNVLANSTSQCGYIQDQTIRNTCQFRLKNTTG